MNLVTTEDLDTVKEEFCEDVMRGYVGDGIHLYDYITLYRPNWVKVSPLPEAPFSRFKKLSRWHYQDATEPFHKYVVNIHHLTRKDHLGEDDDEFELICEDMDVLYPMLEEWERAVVVQTTTQIQKFFDSL